MKISVVARHASPQTRQIREEAKKAGVGFEMVNIDNLTRVRERIEELGEVVIWRTASLSIGVGRTAFLTRLRRKRIVVNAALADKPFAAFKFYQQKQVEPLKTILSIPTYLFKSKKRLLTAVDKGILVFPLVMKANLGARGEKVFLIRSRGELEKREEDVREFVFQNFIKNKGDYRVLVLGGAALGVIKRVAQGGEFRNNVSQGGQVFEATASPEAEALMEKAATLASLFGLSFCGVDFIKNEETGEFHFLEINTVAQWQGFAAATGINVAAELVKYCRMMAERETANSPELIQKYLNSFEKYLPPGKRLHYLSRLYLWTKKEEYRKRLDEIRPLVLGEAEEGIRNRIVQLIKEAEEDQRKMVEKRETVRRSHYLKYPLLSKANNLLFYWLTAKTLYGSEVRPLVEEVMSVREMADLRESLRKDETAVRHLSTAAVNFFYLTAEYLSLARPEIDWWLSLLRRPGEKGNKVDLKTAVYLLTHIVIGESLFYSKAIENKRGVRKVLKMAEKIIAENYFALTLDTKLEFLVCCQMASYHSGLKKLILGEAKRSFSPLGNFLVDSHNDWQNRHAHKLVQAEHRNVLYLMVGARVIL